MRNDLCTFCNLPVLEVKGQFQKLDSYYLDESDLLDGSAGYWHTSCLKGSPYGAGWHDLRLKNFTTVRGYQLVANVGEWSVIQHPRTKDPLAISTSGDFLSLVFPAGRIRRVAQGSVHRVEEPEYNLHLEEAPIIQAVKDALSSVGTFPVLALFEALGIADRALHPEALEGSLIHFSRSQTRNWAEHSVAARWEYGVFIPEALEQYVTRGSKRAS